MNHEISLKIQKHLLIATIHDLLLYFIAITILKYLCITN